MPLFSVDGGRPVATSPVRPAEMAYGATVVDEHLGALLGEHLLPVRVRSGGEDEPYLLAVDVLGRPVVVEVVGVLDGASLLRALAHLGRAARLSLRDLATRYRGGSQRFTADLATFRESVPAAQLVPDGRGARLLLVCAQVGPGPGRRRRGAHRPRRSRCCGSAWSRGRTDGSWTCRRCGRRRRTARGRCPAASRCSPTAAGPAGRRRAAGRGHRLAGCPPPATGSSRGCRAAPTAPSATRPCERPGPPPARRRSGGRRRGRRSRGTRPDRREGPPARLGCPCAGTRPSHRSQPITQPGRPPPPGSAPGPDERAIHAWPRLAARGPLVLVWHRQRRGQTYRALVRTDGLIELADGTRVADPSAAAEIVSGAQAPIDGWRVWRVGGDAGPTLAEACRG